MAKGFSALAILISGAILVSITLAIYFALANEPYLPPAPSSYFTPRPKQITEQIVPNATGDPNATQEHTFGNMTITIPESWTATSRSIVPVGTLINANPKNVTPLQETVFIQSVPTSQLGVSNILQAYPKPFYSQKTAKIAGEQATKVTGTNKTGNNLLHQTIWVFAKGDNLYTINTTYVDQKKNKKLQEQLDKIANTFVAL